MLSQMSVLWWARKLNLWLTVSCNSSKGMPGDLILPDLYNITYLYFSALSRCMHCIVPPGPVLRRLSKSLQLGSCLTRPSRLRPPTPQLMLQPMLLVGPSNLSHKQTRPHTCTHAHKYKHTLTHTNVGGVQLWPCRLSDQMNSFYKCCYSKIGLHTLLKKK